MRAAAILLTVFVGPSAIAAEYYVCERSDGTVHIADRASVLPADCGARRIASFEPAGPATAAASEARWAAIDTLVAEAKERRKANAVVRDEWVGAMNAAARELIERRMALEDTQSRLASERWRWTAFMPGQWIILFADERHVRNLERREAVLRADVAESIAAVHGLRAEAMIAGVGPAELEALTPDLSPPPVAPKMDIEGWGH